MSSSMVFGVLLVCIAVVLAKPAGEEKPVPTLQGTCPDYKGVALDGLKLDGEWFGTHYAKNGFEKKAGTVKCVKKSVTLKPDGKVDSVLSAIKDGQQKSKTIHATPIAGQTGKFTLSKDGADASESNISKTATLLAVDDKCMVDVICGTAGDKHGYMVSVFCRAATADAASLEKVKSALTAAGITDELKAVEGC